MIVNFNYTGGQQVWTVPNDVSMIQVEAWGASGGGPIGGKGGYSKAKVKVTPGETLYIFVGQAGDWGTSSKFNGGGGSSYSGSSGGGATDIRQSGNDPTKRIVVAGGGGGQSNYGRPGGTGAGANNRGGNGSTYQAGQWAATGGYMGVGGSAGGGSGNGTNGTSTNGGKAGEYAGGGGGGYGGGGGAGYASGGAGGGGYAISTATNVEGKNGIWSGNGKLTITFFSYKHLINDNGSIKRFIGGDWEIVGSLPVTSEMFSEYGMNSLSNIDNNAINKLTSSTPEVLTYAYADSSLDQLHLDINAIPYVQLLVPINNLSYKGELNNVTMNVTETGSGKIRYLVSNDNGTSWRSYKNNEWIFVNGSDGNEIITNGMTTSQINALTSTEWKNVVKNSQLKIGYYFDKSNISDSATVNSFNLLSKYSTVTPTATSINIQYDSIDKQYYGLLFMDETESYFSTNVGDVLKYLDFNTLVGGQDSLEVKITLINSFNFKTKNISLLVDENIDGVEVELSKGINPFVPSHSLFYDQILNSEDKIEFYVRLRTAKGTKVGGSFNIKVKAIPAE